MKLWSTPKRVEIVAIGFVMGQADQFPVAQLDEQRDVTFANRRPQIAVTRECLSFGEKIGRGLIGFEFFAEYDSRLSFFGSLYFSRAFEAFEEKSRDVKNNQQRQYDHNILHDRVHPARALRSRFSALREKLSQPFLEVLNQARERIRSFCTQSALMILVAPLSLYGYLSGVDILNPGAWPVWYAVAYSVTGPLSSILLTPVWMLGLSLLYVDERVRHEGYDIELMAARQLGEVPDINVTSPLGTALYTERQQPPPTPRSSGSIFNLS